MSMSDEWILSKKVMDYVQLVPERKIIEEPPDSWSKARDRDRARENKYRQWQEDETQKRINDGKSNGINLILP